MNIFKKTVSVLSLLFSLLIVCSSFSECSAKEPITSIQQLNSPEYTVAVFQSGVDFMAVERDLPKAKVIYAIGQQGIDAVKMGRADAYAYNRTQMEIAISDGLTGVKLLPGSIGEKIEIAIGISRASKIPDLKQKVNQFISEMKSSGTLQDMYQRWTKKAQYTMLDIDMPENSENKIVIGTTGLIMAFSFYVGNDLTGYDIELGRRLALWLGRKAEFRVYDFDGLIAALSTGEIDCAMSCLNVTPERAEVIDFSDTLFTEEVALMIKDDTPVSRSDSEKYEKVSDFNGKRIGVFTGSVHSQIVREVLPSAEIFYFDGQANIFTALLSGKIDAIAYDDALLHIFENENSSLGHIEEYLKTFDNAFIFAKTPKADSLRNNMNEFIRSLKTDGTLRKILDVWLGDDEELKTIPDYENYPATNGTLKIAFDIENPPFTYMKDRKFAGYDVAVILRFCKAKGYKPEFSSMNFDAIIPSVVSEKCDVGIGAITITEERKENINFSEPVYTGGAMILTLKDNIKRPSTKYTKISDLEGKKIAVVTGSTLPDITLKFVPTAKLAYFDTLPDTFTALKTRKVDAVCSVIPMARMIMAEDDSIVFLGEQLTYTDCAPIFAKNEHGEKLCEQFSEFIKAQWDNGTIEEIDSIWFGKDESKKVIKDYTKLPAPNGTLKLATEITVPPYVYVKDNKMIGYDIDCVVRFCETYGYGLEIVPMNFTGIIPAVQSGKCDFGICGITRTEEREESVLFSYPNLKAGNAFVVMKSDVASENPSHNTSTNEPADDESFIEDIRASFERTFIREDRWKLFVDGIISTMIITVMSILFGTILGFLVYLSCRGGNIIANLLTRFFVWLIQGMPMVVLLMILYYIVFGKVDIAGMWVAVFAFSLTFGAGVYGMLLSGVNALDKGQIEAAYALGFTDRRAFFTIILPQAALHFMPAYKAEVVALIKATAIVGYIAVQDLTKMGDIVRSRTYEAFFPLIAVAVIYFILAGMLNVIVGMIHNRIRPEKRTKNDILRGIEIHD